MGSLLMATVLSNGLTQNKHVHMRSKNLLQEGTCLPTKTAKRQTKRYPRPAVTADVVAITKEEVPDASDSERLRAIQGMLGIPRWFHGNE